MVEAFGRVGLVVLILGIATFLSSGAEADVFVQGGCGDAYLVAPGPSVGITTDPRGCPPPASVPVQDGCAVVTEENGHVMAEGYYYCLLTGRHQGPVQMGPCAPYQPGCCTPDQPGCCDVNPDCCYGDVGCQAMMAATGVAAHAGAPVGGGFCVWVNSDETPPAGADTTRTCDDPGTHPEHMPEVGVSLLP